MFTGIITDIGIISALKQHDGITTASIKTSYNLENVTIGASISCSGVCLTVTSKNKDEFTVDISAETLSCTTSCNWVFGTKLNLERALCLGDELGGHIVSGHVDMVVCVDNITQAAGAYVITFQAPDNKFIAAKGSVTIDGVSLTVNELLGNNNFTVNIIPHSLQHTTLGNLSVGSKVNLEIDMLARYVARALQIKM